MRHESLYMALASLLVLTSVFVFSQQRTGLDRVNASFSGNEDAWAVLEIADNSSEREKGLMYRRNLSNHEGMLFVFPGEGERVFWMKNTYVSLDIIFLNSSRHVVNIETAVPQPNASEKELKRYRSEGPAMYVVEVKAGFAENYSIKKGDKVSWN
ncbi:MAG: DUF192 domain-containing protein [Candidatus Nanohaloarchaea archaeon]